jgi:FkbM family methyltransferase
MPSWSDVREAKWWLYQAARVANRLVGDNGGMRVRFIRLPLKIRDAERRTWLVRHYSRVLAEQPPPRVLTAPIAGGMLMELDTSEFVQRVMLVSANWEPSISAVVERLVRPGDTFVDVGANVGYYTLLAAPTVGPTGQMFAFEPAEKIFSGLARNVELNGLSWVHARQIGVGATRAVATVEPGPPGKCGETRLTRLEPRAPGAAVPGAAAGGSAVETITILPLTELLDGLDPSRPALVKIDVEGLEPDVLAGLEPLLLDALPEVALFVECTPEAWECGSAWWDDFVQRHGFEVYELANGYTVEDLYPVRIEPPVRLTAPPERVFDAVLVRGPEMRARLGV